jgi:hypothetical protein
LRVSTGAQRARRRSTREVNEMLIAIVLVALLLVVLGVAASRLAD